MRPVEIHTIGLVPVVRAAVVQRIEFLNNVLLNLNLSGVVPGTSTQSRKSGRGRGV